MNGDIYPTPKKRGYNNTHQYESDVNGIVMGYQINN